MDSWRKKNSSFVLNCRYGLVNYYSEKGFFVIKHNSKHSRSALNDVKLRIYAIGFYKKIFLWRAPQQIPQ